MTRESAGSERGQAWLVMGWLVGLAAALLLACGAVLVLHAHHGAQASAAVRLSRTPAATGAADLVGAQLSAADQPPAGIR